MSQTTPPTITAAPAPPQRGNRSTFSNLFDAFILWIVTAVAQFQALAANVYANAVDAFTSATASAASAIDSSNSASRAFNSAATALSIASAPAYNDTSTSSLAIATGSKVFTVAAGKSWGAGMNMVAQATAGNSMTGTVASYSGTTLTLTIVSVSGSGTFASWAIGLAPPRLGLVLLTPPILPTAAATVNALNVFSATYDSYLIVGQGISANGGALAMFFQFANSGVIDATANNYAVTSTLGSSATFNQSSGNIYGNAAGTPLNGNFIIEILNVNDPTGNKTAIADAYCELSATTFVPYKTVSGYRGGAISGISIFPNTGTFKEQGSIRIYGVQKA
jgi:hypothetical protein